MPPEKQYLFQEALNEASKEAKAVITFILNDMEKLGLGPDTSAKEIRGELKRYLFMNTKMSWNKLTSAFKEIKQMVTTG